MNGATIFFICEDDHSRPMFRAHLKKKGYIVLPAIDEEDALSRVSHGCLRANLILMNLLRKEPEEVLAIGRNICRVGNLDVPLVVMANRFGADLEGRDVPAGEKGYITYLEDAEQLYDLLYRLLPPDRDEILMIS